MAGRKKRVTPVNGNEAEDPRDEYLSLFVMDSKGNIRGESIGVEEDQIIIKDEDRFLRLPMKNVELIDGKLKIKGRINWKKARKEGEKWKIRELDPL